MPVHFADHHTYRPAAKDRVIAVFKNSNTEKKYDFLDVMTGINEGPDKNYWKESYMIMDGTGSKESCCPGLLYPKTMNMDEVWSRLAERLGPFVFPTSMNWTPELSAEENLPPPNELLCWPYNCHLPQQQQRWQQQQQQPSPRDSTRTGHQSGSGVMENGSYSRGRDHQVVENEQCPMCADRRTWWAMSPPIFLSRHSRRWHLHFDALLHFVPRRQFRLKPIEHVEYA